MWAYSLAVRDYQNLIDRGWRRSGAYCYKPIMDDICCPMYTIRCDPTEFKMTKSQKKILKRMIKFLKGELRKDQMDTADENDRGERCLEVQDHCKRVPPELKDLPIENEMCIDDELSNKLNSRSETDSKVPIDITVPTTSKPQNTKLDSPSDNKKKKNQNMLLNSDETLPKKAKLLRIERKKKKLLAQGKSEKEIDDIFKSKKRQSNPRTLESFFEEISNSSTMKLKLKVVEVATNKLNEHNSFEASVQLYQKYQMAIHGDDPLECSEKMFYNFLVYNTLKSRRSENGPPQGYGSFHEQYWLNDELIAVGVLDILPYCVSSVYFFYDPAYSHLSLGTFSSLYEIYLTRQLMRTSPDLRYYYMGFYIHSCPKMRYKAKMKPSKLLCPETYVWCDIEKCLPKLDKSQYSRLNEDMDAIDEDANVDIGQCLILHRRLARIYKNIKDSLFTRPGFIDEEELKEYAALIGKKCLRTMLMYRE
ncbi:arginyl-tRNA--protein transferase 1 isoform X2 [Orussus abietinus]|nr:arginyl-tRNA--protein transferase 1 isoform X2 [Orussus abietinus]